MLIKPRGSGVLRKVQPSWNISVTKQAGIIDGMSFSGNLFLPIKKIVKTNKHTSKWYFKPSYWLQNRQSSLKGSKQQFIRLFSVVLSSTLQSPLCVEVPLEAWEPNEGELAPCKSLLMASRNTSGH